MNYNEFARELIEKQCGTHSLALIYNFLLSAGYDADEAEAEFVRFLSGELSERLAKVTRLWVAEEQACQPAIPITELMALNKSRSRSAMPELLPA